jgi:hypothetical protein
VRIRALVTSGSRETVELYLDEAAARAELADVRRDDPDLAELCAVIELPWEASSPGFVARMKCVSCCCLSLAGKFASRRKTKIALPSSLVSSSAGMLNWL